MNEFYYPECFVSLGGLVPGNGFTLIVFILVGHYAHPCLTDTGTELTPTVVLCRQNSVCHGREVQELVYQIALPNVDSSI